MKNIANFIAGKRHHSPTQSPRNQPNVSPRGASPQTAHLVQQAQSIQPSSSPFVTLGMKLSKSVTTTEANQEANLSIGTTLNGIAAEIKKDEQNKNLGELYEKIAEGIKTFEGVRTEMLTRFGTQVVGPVNELGTYKEKELSKINPHKQTLLLCDFLDIYNEYFQKSLELLQPFLSISQPLRESTVLTMEKEAVEKAEREAAEKAEKERVEQEKVERAEKEKAEKEQAEKDRAEKEQAEKEQAEKDKAEKEKVEKEEAEKTKTEGEAMVTSKPTPIADASKSMQSSWSSPALSITPPTRYTAVVSGKDQESFVESSPPAELPLLQGFSKKEKRRSRSPRRKVSQEEPILHSHKQLSEDHPVIASPSSPGSTKGINLAVSVAGTGTGTGTGSVPASKGDYFSRTKSSTWAFRSSPVQGLVPNQKSPRGAIPNFDSPIIDRSQAISGVMTGIGAYSANQSSPTTATISTSGVLFKPQRAWDSETSGPLLKTSFGDFVNEEEKFCQYMGLVIEKFARPFKEDDKFSSRIFEEDVANIFLYIDQIYAVSSKLLVELHFCLRNWPLPTPGLYFLDRINVLEVYINYAANYGNAVFSLKRARKLSKSVKQYLEQTTIEEQDLSALLALPLKIISRWWSFFDTACHNITEQDEDNKHFPIIAAKLKELNEGVTFHVEQYELLQQVRAVQKKLQGLSETIAQPGRRFLREGSSELKPEGTEVQLFLFSDMLIEARPAFSLKKPPTSNMAKTLGKSLGKVSKMIDKFKFSRKIMLRRAVITELGATEPSFKITEGNTTIIYGFDHVVTRAGWVQELQKTIATLNKNTVYGLPLEELMTEREKDRDIPLVVEKTINYLISNGLSVEGLFRVCGSQKRIDEIRTSFDNGIAIEFQSAEENTENEVHAVAGVLKLWIRSLPAPLIVADIYEEVIAANRLEVSDSEKATKLKELIEKMPKYNKYLLQHLMSFCVLVSAHSESNKMTSSNMSIVIGPNILYNFNRDSMDYAAQAASISDQKDVTDVVQMFIDDYDEIFKDIETERRREKEKQRTKPPAPQTPLRKALPPTPGKKAPASPSSSQELLQQTPPELSSSTGSLPSIQLTASSTSLE